MGKGKLTTVAYGQDDRTKLGEGTLLLVNNTISQSSGTIQLKATFPNENQALWPGEFVNVRLIVGVRHDGISVPLSALVQGGSRLARLCRRRRRHGAAAPGDGRRDARRPRLDRSGTAAGRHRGDGGSVPARRRRQGSSTSRRAIRACRTTPKPARGCCDEHVRPVHPPPGRDRAADGGDRSAGRHRVRAVAGGGAAECLLPDHHGHRAACRAPIRRRWPPRWRHRSKSSSAKSPI